MEENTPETPVNTGPAPTEIDALDWLAVQFQSFILTLWDMLKDFLLLIVDLFMDLGIAILNGLSSALQLVDLSQYISGMPGEVQAVFANTGLGTAVGMVMLAGTTRLLMQLIPFVRLGS